LENYCFLSGYSEIGAFLTTSHLTRRLSLLSSERIQQAASSATPLEAIPGFVATFDSFIEQLHDPT
jgi:hypothetical protein